jgi:hypothetical protein
MRPIIITVAAILAAASLMMAQDAIDLPPLERREASLSGVYTLVMRAVDGWKTPFVFATLKSASGRIVWERQLPHQHGPRRALVTDDGYVLLVDDWINVVSPRALMLLDPTGKTLVTHSAEEIFKLLSVPLPSITEHARFGPWLTDGPDLAADSRVARFRAGGRTFEIDLHKGRIYLRQ